MEFIDALPVLDLGAELGEGPVWDACAGCLFSVDIMRGIVHRYDPRTSQHSSFDIGQPVGAVVPSKSGDLILAVRDGFARLDLASGRTHLIARVEGDRPARMNDGNCDAAGRFWAGTMALDERPHGGALYCLDGDGQVRLMLRDVTISNGIDWSDDGRFMYYIDSGTHRVDWFDFDLASGSISNRRPFVSIPATAGVPDGLTLDAGGCVWVALWGGGRVHRFTPEGRLDLIVRLPTTHPTSVAFGGDDLQDLYITTATIALTPSARTEQPHAGALFRCRPGATGRVGHRFSG